MNEVIRRDILSTLAKVLEILKLKEESDAMELKELSNTTIHNASVYQDQDSISIAVIIYSLSKIFERTGDLDEKTRKHLFEMHSFLSKGNEIDFHRAVRNTMLHISHMDRKVGLYIEQVIQQARIKKGTKLYEHGLSVAQSADLLGISQWQLLDYIGKTTITDYNLKLEDVKKRLDFARGMFKS